MNISRVRRPKRAAKKSYDQMSTFYDLMAGSSEEPLMRLGLELLDIHTDETVLEIGPGTGKALIEISQRTREKGSVVGLDLSTGMLHMASKNLTKAGLTSHTHLLSGDGALLPFTSDAFSAVFISFTLELFDTPEIPAVLLECKRVLKAGGRLGVVAMLKPDRDNWVVRLYEWFHDKIPNYVDCRPIIAGEMIPAAGFNLERRMLKSMWALPVEILVARKG